MNYTELVMQIITTIMRIRIDDSEHESLLTYTHKPAVNFSLLKCA